MGMRVVYIKHFFTSFTLKKSFELHSAREVVVQRHGYIGVIPVPTLSKPPGGFGKIGAFYRLVHFAKVNQVSHFSEPIPFLTCTWPNLEKSF